MSRVGDKMGDTRALPDGTGSREPNPQAVSALRASIPNAGRFYRTCKNCAFDHRACERRAELEAGVKGLCLTGVTFRCDLRQPFYRVGQRVGVTWNFVLSEWGWGYEEGMSAEEWPATVVAETKRGFRIVVDDVPSDSDTPARDYIKSDSLYCNVTAGRLRPLDEPDRSVCGYCGSAENGDGTVTGCWAPEDGCVGLFRAESCLAKAMEARRAETGTGSVVDDSAVGNADLPEKEHPHGR